MRRDLLQDSPAQERSRRQANRGEGPFPFYFGLANEKGYPHSGAGLCLNQRGPDTGTLQLRGIFPNPGPIHLPGLFVRVRVTAPETRNALMVPAMRSASISRANTCWSSTTRTWSSAVA